MREDVDSLGAHVILKLSSLVAPEGASSSLRSVGQATRHSDGSMALTARFEKLEIEGAIHVVDAIKILQRYGTTHDERELQAESQVAFYNKCLVLISIV